MKPAATPAGEGTPKVVQGELDFPLATDGAVHGEGLQSEESRACEARRLEERRRLIKLRYGTDEGNYAY